MNLPRSAAHDATRPPADPPATLPAGRPIHAPARPGPLRTAARALLRSGRGRILLGVFAAWLAFQGWLSWTAPGKIVGAFPADREKVNILVTLPFAPERFHVLVFQRFGRVSGTDGNTIEVRSVKQTDLVRLARPYWVSRVEPLKP